MEFRVGLSVLSCFLSFWKGSNASICGNRRLNLPENMTREEYLKHNCCSSKDRSDESEFGGYSMSTVYCSTGCCGDLDNEDCCDDGLNGTEIGIIVGCSLFGLLVLVGLGLVLVWVFSVCFNLRQFHRNRASAFTEEYTAATRDEMFLRSQSLATYPGTAEDTMDSSLDPPFSQTQTAGSTYPLPYSEDNGNEHNSGRFSQPPPSYEAVIAQDRSNGK